VRAGASFRLAGAAGAGGGSAGHWLSGISPAAAANAASALATADCFRAGSLRKISAISARRRAVA